MKSLRRWFALKIRANAETDILENKIKSLIKDIDEVKSLIGKGQKNSGLVQSLTEDVKSLRRLFLEGKQIDLVQLGNFYNFMFINDLAYENVPEKYRNKGDISSSVLLKHNPEVPQQDLDGFILNWKRSNGYVENRLIAHFMKYLSDFIVVDVGCQYGSSAMQIASFIRSLGGDNRIIAFDPGQAGALASFNFLNNGFSDMIDFYPYSVGNIDGYVLMFKELGHSENNRIVNRLVSSDALSKPVRCVKLRNFLRDRDLVKPLFIKIDTQGAEYEVFQGMDTLLTENITAGIAEFTPAALATRTDPVKFIEKLDSTHIIFDLGFQYENTARRFQPVNRNAFSKFTTTISESNEQWTDLLLVPRNLPRLEELLTSYEKACSGQGFDKII